LLAASYPINLYELVNEIREGVSLKLA
jgi:hypothetical protein